jgi:hypothetical protein
MKRSQKDLELAYALISRGIIDRETLLKRIEELPPGVQERVRNRAVSDFQKSASSSGSAL